MKSPPPPKKNFFCLNISGFSWSIFKFHLSKFFVSLSSSNKTLHRQKRLECMVVFIIAMKLWVNPDSFFFYLHDILGMISPWHRQRANNSTKSFIHLQVGNKNFVVVVTNPNMENKNLREIQDGKTIYNLKHTIELYWYNKVIFVPTVQTIL